LCRVIRVYQDQVNEALFVGKRVSPGMFAMSYSPTAAGLLVPDDRLNRDLQRETGTVDDAEELSVVH
jgi:hypothetical protein